MERGVGGGEACAEGGDEGGRHISMSLVSLFSAPQELRIRRVFYCIALQQKLHFNKCSFFYLKACIQQNCAHAERKSYATKAVLMHFSNECYTSVNLVSFIKKVCIQQNCTHAKRKIIYYKSGVDVFAMFSRVSSHV